MTVLKGKFHAGLEIHVHETTCTLTDVLIIGVTNLITTFQPSTWTLNGLYNVANNIALLRNILG